MVSPVPSRLPVPGSELLWWHERGAWYRLRDDDRQSEGLLVPRHGHGLAFGDGFELEQGLGSGGTGTVFRAMCRKLDEDIVLRPLPRASVAPWTGVQAASGFL